MRAFWLLDCPRGRVGLSLESTEHVQVLEEPELLCPLCEKSHDLIRVAEEEYDLALRNEEQL